MKILHIGWGFKHWWDGGYIEYLLGLLNTQIKHGYRVAYFCTGRYYPSWNGPHIIRWKIKSIELYEIINSPLIERETLQIKLGDDLANKACEQFLRETLDEFHPDVVHIHHVLGLPTSIIDIVKDDYRLPLVMTVHDYYMLCPKINLFDYMQQNCTEKDIDHKCKICLRESPMIIQPYIIKTSLELKNYYFCIICSKLRPLIKNVLSFFFKRFAHRQKSFQNVQKPNTIDPALSFQKRRDKNIERFGKIDCLVCPSEKVAEIMTDCGHNSKNIKIIPHALRHIESIKAVEFDKVKLPLDFIVLNGCSSALKGAKLVHDAVELLNKKRYSDRFNLHIYGRLSDKFGLGLLQHGNVYFHGSYSVSSLNKILSGKQVGVIPSLCNETYGITGIEMLAKGIPVIGNNRGGIVDYVKEKRTGWINKSATTEELVEIIISIINSPGQINELNNYTIKNRKIFIKTLSEHFTEIESLYKKALSVSCDE